MVANTQRTALNEVTSKFNRKWQMNDTMWSLTKVNFLLKINRKALDLWNPKVNKLSNSLKQIMIKTKKDIKAQGGVCKTLKLDWSWHILRLKTERVKNKIFQNLRGTEAGNYYRRTEMKTENESKNREAKVSKKAQIRRRGKRCRIFLYFPNKVKYIIFTDIETSNCISNTTLRSKIKIF